MKVLLIIPAYNEEASILGVVEELNAQGFAYDYLVVNDGSADGTRQVCRQAGINALHLPINLGIGGAVQAGYQYALEQGYDIAVQMDGDGQHDPRFLPRLIDPIAGGQADYVIGSRYLENGGYQSTRLRRLGGRVLGTVLQFFAGVRVADATSGFRAVNRQLIGLFAHAYAQDYPEPEAIIQAAVHGYTILEVPVDMRERQGGQSSIGRWSAVYYMVKVVLSIALNRIVGKREGRP